MEEKILAVLSEEITDVDFTSSDTLVDSGILDSLTIMRIVTTLAVEFDVDISFDEIVEENFNSITGMARMIERLQGK